MPLSLVYPFAIAGGAGYLIVRGSPLGPLGALFGMLTALLPVFIGDAPAQDVDGSYGMVCGLLLGVAAGLIAQRLLWPRTAMQTFTERTAGQLDLCQRALGERGSEGTAPDRGAAALLGAYAKQLTLLGKLHAQAHVEPVERALDDARRGELLALMQDLFDASLRARRTAAKEEGSASPDAEAALAPLREALARHDAAILSSMAASAQALRGAAPAPDPGLREAQAALEAQIAGVRGRTDVVRSLGAHRTSEFLATVAERRKLAAGQLAIEAWLTGWRQAVAAAA